MGDECSHYWFPVPAYASKHGESHRCNCGFVCIKGRIQPPPTTGEADTREDDRG